MSAPSKVARLARMLRVAAGLVFTVPAFAQGALGLAIVAPVTEVRPGGAVEISAITRNTSSSALNGLYLHKVTIDRGAFVSVSTDNPAVTCAKVPASTGEAFQCMGSSVVLQPNQTVAVYSRVRTPSDAGQGSRVRFASTVSGFGGQVASGLLFLTIQGQPAGAPKLELKTGFGPFGGVIFRVTNAGDADTEGPIYLEMWPFQGTVFTVLPDPETFPAVGSRYRYRRDSVLAPDASFDVVTNLLAEAVRGTAGYHAEVTGGGSPPFAIQFHWDEALRQLKAALQAVPVEPIEGRVRP